jgi:hypothetical protein
MAEERFCSEQPTFNPRKLRFIVEMHLEDRDPNRTEEQFISEVRRGVSECPESIAR